MFEPLDELGELALILGGAYLSEWLEDTRRFGIGGNQPPEEPEIVTETLLAGGSLLSVLQLDQVLPVPIKYAVRGLKRVKGWMGAGVTLLAAQAAKGYVQGVTKKMGEDDVELIRHLEAMLTAIAMERRKAPCQRLVRGRTSCST